MNAQRPRIDADLVRRLVSGQFPHWSTLPVAAVEPGGVDNRTFRLGDQMTVRLPAGEWYALQVAKEQAWLPRLAPELPLPIPVPVGRGVPAEGYPYPWSVYGWLDGETASPETIDDLTEFAGDLARFLAALGRIDPVGGPAPGAHNFFRGGPLTTYAEDTVRAISALNDRIPSAALGVWNDAAGAPWTAAPVWFHGDVAVGNLLVRDGRLAAVIDFGTSGVGDPACDLVIAWTLFSGPSRRAFRETLAVDPGTWSRGRGWALWKAAITLVDQIDRDPAGAEVSRRVIEEVIADAVG
jgi:aminoglycoside phosphotransferase (APT) family kinase protein